MYGPPKYVGAPIPQPSAGAGANIASPNGTMIRPVIPRLNGGKRKKLTKRNSKRSKKG